MEKHDGRVSIHCKSIRRFYGIITGNQLPVHFPLLCPQLWRSWRGILVWACPSVCLSVTLFGTWETQEPLMLESWNFICGMYMKNKQTRIFFPPPVLWFWSYDPFSTMYEQPCEQNIWRTAKARSYINRVHSITLIPFQIISQNLVEI